MCEERQNFNDKFAQCLVNILFKDLYEILAQIINVKYKHIIYLVVEDECQRISIMNDHYFICEYHIVI